MRIRMSRREPKYCTVAPPKPFSDSASLTAATSTGFS